MKSHYKNSTCRRVQWHAKQSIVQLPIFIVLAAPGLVL